MTKQSRAVAAASPAPQIDHSHFDDFNTAVGRRFLATVLGRERQLLTVSTEGLYDLYLTGFAPHERQEHDCRCCRRFVEQYGGLVAVTDSGALISAVWPSNDEGPYGAASRLVANRVEHSDITGVFMTNKTSLGVGQSGGWHHLQVPVPTAMHQPISDDALSYSLAQKVQDVVTLRRGLHGYEADTINTALELLRSDALYRAEKVLGPVEFLAKVRATHDSTRGKARDNLMWRHVADAPPGFCTPRSSMAGTLLDDIADGMSFERVKARFADKMAGDKYMRPVAPPTAGNIAQAERLIAEMNLEPALQRRFARLDEIQTVWTPKPAPKAAAPSAGVFAHLQPKGQSKPSAMLVRGGAITWEKFQRTVLPIAQSMEFVVGTGRMNWGALVTAVNPDAPPLLQWDSWEERNPVSTYRYTDGSPAEQWQIKPGLAKVNAIAFVPSMWNGNKHPHQGQAVMFIIDGARDRTINSLCLFPETLRSELHGVRATIEAYSAAGKIQGADEASACGVFGPGNCSRVRVTSSTGVTEYHIDRWD